ncbi:TetR/AcrR family transcriptional regulator [Streptomyces bauhiniae]|uniref:TetR/AcrR family transcriptional regulator n=1 Tax=Streptomyces bauhiniae TaxID=2340725 RepID=UPI0036B76CF7
MTSVDEPARPDRRLPDAARTRSDILDAATREFARAGYDGARVEEIAARTRTTKRMIYYYFGGKKQLFAAVLERAYGALHEVEELLDLAHPDLDHLDPAAAVRRLAEVTFDHHERHPDLVRLVGIENIHGGEHLAAARRFGRIDSPGLDTLRRVLDAGREQGVFKADVDAVDLHAMISAFCFYRVAGRHTFGALFDRDLAAPARREHYREMLADMVLAYLTR